MMQEGREDRAIQPMPVKSTPKRATVNNAVNGFIAHAVRLNGYFIECSPNMLPSVSSPKVMNPYWPIDILGRWTLPPAFWM